MNRGSGFLREVSKLAAAHRRPSTNRMYNDRWLRFTNWATGKGFDPLGPTAAQIATFCMSFLYSWLVTSDYQRYRSCLAWILIRTCKVAAVQAKTISDMIMSMELQRPRLTPVLPQWDLGIVLEA